MTQIDEAKLRQGCCVRFPKPCTYHEGYLDGYYAAAGDGYDDGYKDGAADGKAALERLRDLAERLYEDAT